MANPSGPSVVVDNLRAYLQITDVASILGLDCDITARSSQLFRDCSSATSLRNRSVDALATAALVQAIREAQEPRTLQVRPGYATTIEAFDDTESEKWKNAKEFRRLENCFKDAQKIAKELQTNFCGDLEKIVELLLLRVKKN